MKARIEEAVKALVAKCVGAAYYDHSVIFAGTDGDTVIVLKYDSDDQVIEVIKWLDFEPEYIVDFHTDKAFADGADTFGLETRLTYFLEGELV